MREHEEAEVKGPQTPPHTYLCLARLERELLLWVPAAAVGVHARLIAYMEWRQRRAVRPELYEAFAEVYDTTSSGCSTRRAGPCRCRVVGEGEGRRSCKAELGPTDLECPTCGGGHPRGG